MKKFVSILLILALTLSCFAVAETTEETTYLIDDTEVTGAVCKARVENDGWKKTLNCQSTKELFTSSLSEKNGMGMVYVMATVPLFLMDFDFSDIDINDVRMCLMTDGVLLICFNLYSDNRVGYFACYPSMTEFSCGYFEPASAESSKSSRIKSVLDCLKDNGCLVSNVIIPTSEILDAMAGLIF